MERNFDMFVRLDLYPTFNLEKAVCNHGLFMMAPNRWIPPTKTLQRPLRLSESTGSLVVSVSSHATNSLLIRVHGTQYLSNPDRCAVLGTQVLGPHFVSVPRYITQSFHSLAKGQVRRMLRISDKDESDVREFHKLHSQAKLSGFGRLFRSPTLFEDVVKSILLCNCGWGRTLEMATALCELQDELTNEVKHGKNNSKKTNLQGKRKRSSNTISIAYGNFPNPQELAAIDRDFLQKRCNLGYRAKQIVQIAIKFQNDELKHIKELEEHNVLDNKTYEDLHTALLKVKGFGPFTCANILMCGGYYKRIPQDSETARHLSNSTHHTLTSRKKGDVEKVLKEVYCKYAPFQCLAYWWELLEWYEEKFGKLSELSSSSYNIVTGTTRKK